MNMLAERIADTKFDLHVARLEGTPEDVAREEKELARLERLAFLEKWYSETAGASVLRAYETGNVETRRI